MKHFGTMTEAVRAASRICPGWLVLESGEYLEAPAAEYLAKVTDRLDREDDAEEGIYYLTSDEGAVGVTSKYEYLAQWILIPVMRPMAEIEAEIGKTVRDGLRAKQSESVPETPAFCPYCGYKQSPGAKFCPDCGRRFEG